MNNVVDEVLSSEPRYRISKASTGEILYDDIIIEMITPVVTQGTELNKVLFDSIKTDLTNLFTNKQDNSVTGDFTWSATANTTINLGFKPKLVIAISDSVHINQDVNRTTILLDGYGIMFNGGGGVNNTTTVYFNNTFTSNGFTVKPENTISGVYTFKNASARYIAFK